MSLFAGAGGSLLSDLILGHEPLVAVEWDAYCCQVLRERVSDGWFPNMRVHEGDVRLFDASEYKGRVDCITGGFPCQDISVAGNQAGVGENTRSGLYREVLRISDEVRPGYIFLENVAAIVNGNDGGMLRTVVSDLAERGFDAVWCCLAASQIGAKHKRNRWWLLAFPSKQRCDSGGSDRQGRHVQDNEKRQPPQIQQQGDERQFGSSKACDVFPNAVRFRQSGQRERLHTFGTQKNSEREAGYAIHDGERSERQAKSNMGRVADDMAYRMDVHDWVQEEAQVGRTTTATENRASRLKALGNGQVPLQAATAFSILWEMMEATKGGVKT